MGIMAAVLNVATVRAQTVVVGEQTPWRVWLVKGGDLRREDGKLINVGGHNRQPFNPFIEDEWRRSWHMLSPQPSTNWFAADYDDTGWTRCYMEEVNSWNAGFGSVGQPGERFWAVLTRTRFGVSDPAKVNDLQLEVEYLGGIVVYVNGREVGRSHLPEGQSGILAVADDYPEEAYLMADGQPLPPYRATDQRLQAEEMLARYRARNRKATIRIPSSALVKGGNLIAIENRHAAVTRPMAVWGWSHAGLRSAKLVSAGGAGVMEYAGQLKGTRVWNAEMAEPIAWTLSNDEAQIMWAENKAGRVDPGGILAGNPFDALGPIRIVAPRNGVGVGQAVVSDVDGLKGVKAAVSDLKLDGGASLPSSAVELMYGTRHRNSRMLEGLFPTPPEGANTVPVWLRVRVPKTQASGWYTGTLTITANGKSFPVPVQVWVASFAVPSPKESRLDIGFMQSYDNVANQYQVPLWSDAHWKHMASSFRLMGELSNDSIMVKVFDLSYNAFAFKQHWVDPLIRFVRQGDKLRPEFSRFEKYLDEYLKHAGPPRAISVEVWKHGLYNMVGMSGNGYEVTSRDIGQTTAKPMVRVVDLATGEESQGLAPLFHEPDGEAFYKALILGVRDIAVKRGISERAVMMGVPEDYRPTQEQGELWKKWLPGYRWHFYSHCSNDPSIDGGTAYSQNKNPNDPKVQALMQGRMIATGSEIEMGFREDMGGHGVLQIKALEHQLTVGWEYVIHRTRRFSTYDVSHPIWYLKHPLKMVGQWGRVGLDFWDMSKNAKVSNISYHSQIEAITCPGPEGALPTVRFEMARQGIQAAEARRAIIAMALKLPAEEKAKIYKWYEGLKAYDDDNQLKGQPRNHIASYDWPGIVAEHYALAAKLEGQEDAARWDAPPVR